jgi:hypothetical protein
VKAEIGRNWLKLIADFLQHGKEYLYFKIAVIFLARWVTVIFSTESLP